MCPLTLDDLLPLEEFASQRRTLFEAHLRYLDRYRRVRVGPRLSLAFENRQTLWFRLQDLLRVARLNDPIRVQRELNVYNRLLPGRGQLQAALFIEVVDETSLAEELGPWRRFRGEELRLHLGAAAVPGVLVTNRPEDLAVGNSHWVQFHLDDNARRRLADRRRPARLVIDLPDYQHESELFSEEMRQSLLADLEISDRD
jgi:hypothetical protein